MSFFQYVWMVIVVGLLLLGLRQCGGATDASDRAIGSGGSVEVVR